MDIVRRHRAGGAVGIHSVCSSHPLVLESTLRMAHCADGPVLIEATSNQVNQDGGYTGLRPAEFAQLIHQLAGAIGLGADQILLGGDHLGPNCWKSATAETAMQRSVVLVREYVEAGFRKIHLDCSMSCADDPPALGDELIAERTATLCDVAEAVWRHSGGEAPVYVIGSEVPVPGGATEMMHELAVTTPEAALATVDAHRRAFATRGLHDAWHRVIALVVQPGVEFDNHTVIDYDPAKAAALSQSILAVPGMVFEAHSTDYQTPRALAALVKDHFAILKVGPAVTFALREAFWGLAAIATELGLASGKSLKAALLDAMRRDPRYWSPYYQDLARQEFDLQYSLSDRIRYYWGTPGVVKACALLLGTLAETRLPHALLSQYLPNQFAKIREGRLVDDPREMVLDGVAKVLTGYQNACGTPGTRETASVARGAA